ncbi:hypothetical protein [Bacillus sp. B15-48]|uniref:hypothetical protein n=1 Tax=Bacillus sp. B15-48 TaxID=1548601 RepID=UPI00193EECF1|nr:hypothetical protein [Bacillus sp. B15-48]MBM4764649.1 hypothetical protein [Bacillus sp. B15-48]
MTRLMFSSIGGFILVFIEAYIILTIRGYHTIDFGGIGPFMNVWAMNFFLIFCILTDIKNWLENRTATQENTKNII